MIADFFSGLSQLNKKRDAAGPPQGPPAPPQGTAAPDQVSEVDAAADASQIAVAPIMQTPAHYRKTRLIATVGREVEEDVVRAADPTHRADVKRRIEKEAELSVDACAEPAIDESLRSDQMLVAFAVELLTRAAEAKLAIESAVARLHQSQANLRQFPALRRFAIAGRRLIVVLGGLLLIAGGTFLLHDGVAKAWVEPSMKAADKEVTGMVETYAPPPDRSAPAADQSQAAAPLAEAASRSGALLDEMRIRDQARQHTVAHKAKMEAYAGTAAILGGFVGVPVFCAWIGVVVGFGALIAELMLTLAFAAVRLSATRAELEGIGGLKGVLIFLAEQHEATANFLAEAAIGSLAVMLAYYYGKQIKALLHQDEQRRAIQEQAGFATADKHEAEQELRDSEARALAQWQVIARRDHDGALRQKLAPLFAAAAGNGYDRGVQILQSEHLGMGDAPTRSVPGGPAVASHAAQASPGKETDKV